MTALPQEIDASKRFKYFHILAIFYVVTLMGSLILSARLMPVTLPFTNISLLLTGGTWIIPLSFLVQDLTTEIYGYPTSRRLIQLTLLFLSIMILFFKATTFFPIPSTKNIDISYNAIFDAIPRHFFALIIAITISNFFNDYILSKWKKQVKGKYLGWRLFGSTVIGEALLQLAGTTVAWAGHLDFTMQIIPFVLFSYFYKIVFSALLTPINIKCCKLIKKAEGIDAYDYGVNYNPFIFK